MSLSFGEGENPIATVNKRTLYMNTEMVEDGKKQIELMNDLKFQHIPSNAERDVLYISAMSGSGKTFYTAEFTKQYHKKYPKNEVFLFSSVSEDKALDSMKFLKRINIFDPKFLEMDLTAKDFEKCLLIFDDVDVLTNKKIKAKVFLILDSVLQTGRHHSCSVIFTSHAACNGNQTKIILNEATAIVLFPQTSGNKSLNYICDQYLGLNKKEAADLKKISGRWVTFIRAFPRCILSEKSCKLIQH